jgi:hypothetical protein
MPSSEPISAEGPQVGEVALAEVDELQGDVEVLAPDQ